jgi:membrane protease subunit HflC
MKTALPIVALIVAVLLVLSQSIYTVDQKQYAIKFQLGEFIEAKTEAGLYLKVPLVQNVKFYDRRLLLLDTQEPERITTSEKKPLKIDFIAYWRIVDVRRYYQSVTGEEEAAKRRLAQTIRANLAQEINKRTIHEVISTERDKIMTEARQKADADARNIGVEVVDVRLRRVELPDPTRCWRRCIRAWNRSASGSPTSCARWAPPSRRKSAPTPIASARSSSPTPTCRRRR